MGASVGDCVGDSVRATVGDCDGVAGHEHDAPSASKSPDAHTQSPAVHTPLQGEPVMELTSLRALRPLHVKRATLLLAEL